MTIWIVKCHCGYMANTNECTSLKWVKAPNKHGKFVSMVVCPGTGRKVCGALLEAEKKEFKGLKRLRSRRRAQKEKVAA